MDAITEDVGDYLVNVLRSYPPQNYVTRKAAYGQTFFSDKQRRWFFAALEAENYRYPASARKHWRKAGSGLMTSL